MFTTKRGGGRVKQWCLQGGYKQSARCVPCYNAININYVLVLICRIARELNFSYVVVLFKGVCSLFMPLKLRSAVYVVTGYVKLTKLWELHILRDRIGVVLVKRLNQGLLLHIWIHFTPLNQYSKRIKEILTQKYQYNAKCFSRFNDKNAFRKWKKSIYFSRFQLYS